MWLVLTRAPLPDAPHWPGRRLLALVDAVAWPVGWLVLAAGLLHQSTGLWLLLSAPWLLVAILSIGLAQALGRRRDDARARVPFPGTPVRTRT